MAPCVGGRTHWPQKEENTLVKAGWRIRTLLKERKIVLNPSCLNVDPHQSQALFGFEYVFVYRLHICRIVCECSSFANRNAKKPKQRTVLQPAVDFTLKNHQIAIRFSEPSKNTLWCAIFLRK